MPNRGGAARKVNAHLPNGPDEASETEGCVGPGLT